MLYHTTSQKKLHKDFNVPIGIINSSWGGTPAESWTTKEALLADTEFKPILDRWQEKFQEYSQKMVEYEKKLQGWQEKVDEAKKNAQKLPRKPTAPYGPGNSRCPYVLYNAMINPIVPYTIKGAIWYQGESNTGRAYQYRKLFPAMITSWRSSWKQGDFPFYFVQLANYKEPKLDPVEDGWAELREAQSMVLSLPNTGMAVTIDIGDAVTIYPKNKKDVGERLALWALVKDYNKDIAFSGPLYKSMNIDGNKVIISFGHTDVGLVALDDKLLTQFAIAGEDKKFIWAEAKIAGDTVVVTSPQIDKPLAVRYAWQMNPQGCNLYNKAKLPASLFRTDDWPGVTVKNTVPYK